ncbi:hypothetical protein K2173_006535 [Erythroxylum novogranatense]|uniref:Uncharacterized protein n=1 Tax=Erythroxylum novogranatense TaxID=1862640 RepID=A0AAV8T6V6_9ROSI|nr:hypothetical protein K2173_006535 [Erythroxylum novogranatense]
MGFKKAFRLFSASLALILIFLVSSFNAASSPTSSISSLDIQAKEPTPSRQVFYIKNTTPFFLDRKEQPNKNNGTKKRKMVKKRKKMIKNGPFSVMLPKGLVPPSGSSPCHNYNPNSQATSFCDLSIAEP